MAKNPLKHNYAHMTPLSAGQVQTAQDKEVVGTIVSTIYVWDLKPDRNTACAVIMKK